MALSPLSLYYLVRTAASEIRANPVMDTMIQWGVFVVIFIPIAIGLLVFGYFAFQGEYDHLPESSEEIKD